MKAVHSVFPNVDYTESGFTYTSSPGLNVFELASLLFTAAAIIHGGKGGEDAIRFGIDNAEEFIRIHTEHEAKQP